MATLMVTTAAVRLNEVVMLGTQASYRLAPTSGVAEDVPSLFLCQRPLDRQADFMGVRAFQLDIHRRPAEGDPFPVFHTVFGDDNRTNCNDIQQCMWVLRAWSDRHPGHLPIIVEINGVDEPDEVRDDLRPGWPRVLEQQLTAVVGFDKIYTPFDFVEGDYESINQRVRTQGWPQIEELRDKFIFVLTRFNPSVFTTVTEFVSDPQYPNATNVFFVAACGAYNVDATTGCDLTEANASWAAFGDVDIIGSNPENWALAEEAISTFVDANFVVNSNVCSESDTAWYQRKEVCANKTLLARALGVQLLSDALLSVSRNPDLPMTAGCNPVTSTSATCQDSDVWRQGGPGPDPWYMCDIEQCPLAPPLENRTTPAPGTCVDDNERIRNLTNGFAQTCADAQRIFPDACTNPDSDYYDFSRQYCPVTCGLCGNAAAAAAQTPRPAFAAAAEADDDTNDFGYTDPCGNIKIPQTTSGGGELSNAEVAGIILAIAIFVILVALIIHWRRSRKVEYEKLDG